MKLNDGFFTALGTPIDEKGNLVPCSLEKHINQQIECGASGLLLMGSMGIEPQLKNNTFEDAVRTAVNTVNGRLPLFVGAMDNSIAKVMEKIELMRGAHIDGVVLTVPFYSVVNDEQAINWFTTIADQSPYPVYIYDLAVVTKYKINLRVIDSLINHKNIKGIKTADWEMIHAIQRRYPYKEFECLYSGLDSFDYANMMGIKKNLDGMFACAPKNGMKMVEYNLKGDYKEARKYLDNILYLRDTMMKYGLMVCFTHCMNLLGCEGKFHQDYSVPITDEAKRVMKDIMQKIGEI